MKRSCARIKLTCFLFPLTHLIGWASASFNDTSIFHCETVLAIIEMDTQEQLVACKLHEVGEYELKQQIIGSWSSMGLDVRKLKFVDMVDLIYRCQEVPSVHSVDFSELTPHIEETLIPLNVGVVPNTKWCGFGSSTLEYSQLGSHHELDKCCRAHDFCPVQSSSLTRDNPSPYTLSHCLCDQKFHQCLKNVESSTADIIGKIFFNIVKVQCFTFSEDFQCKRSILGICVDWMDERTPRIVLEENVDY